MTGIVAALAGAVASGGVNGGFTADLQATVLVPGIVSASLTFAPDGQCSSAVAAPPNWFQPTVAGIGASWWVRITGVGANTTVRGMTPGTWYPLASPVSVTYSNSAPSTLGTGTSTVSFSADGGTTVAASGTVSWYVGYER